MPRANPLETHQTCPRCVSLHADRHQDRRAIHRAPVPRRVYSNDVSGVGDGTGDGTGVGAGTGTTCDACGVLACPATSETEKAYSVGRFTDLAAIRILALTPGGIFTCLTTSTTPTGASADVARTAPLSAITPSVKSIPERPSSRTSRMRFSVADGTSKKSRSHRLNSPLPRTRLPPDSGSGVAVCKSLFGSASRPDGRLFERTRNE